MKPIHRHAAMLALAFMLTAPMLAAQGTRSDDQPTPEQRIRIEAALRQLGFVSWRDIEKENDGREWDVDDARTAEGRQFDVRLSVDDLRELSRRLDD